MPEWLRIGLIIVAAIVLGILYSCMWNKCLVSGTRAAPEAYEGDDL